jgi:electron transport complex protein RnfD
MSEQPRLVVAASPHLGGPVDTPKIMWNVVASLAPAMAWATWIWGPSALLVVAASWLGAALPEAYVKGRASLRDGSAALTGILLGMCLPPGFPCWMAFVGGAFGMVAGKLLFGGLGQNVFNPALLGRAFLQAAFPVAITTWPALTDRWFALRGDNLALPFVSPVAPDVVTSATPLNLMKFDRQPSPVLDMFLGRQGGCVGETSDLLLLLGGAWLVSRNFLNWRTPATIFATVAAFAGVLSLVDPARYPGPLFMLFSGGLTLGAVYMATDPVTSPITGRGCVIFGAGVGALVVLIRIWGGLPEGVMYSILIMNAFVPFINRATQPRPFGGKPREAKA